MAAGCCLVAILAFKSHPSASLSCIVALLLAAKTGVILGFVRRMNVFVVITSVELFGGRSEWTDLSIVGRCVMMAA